MKLVRNYWLRWFLGGYVFGVVVLQLGFWLWFGYIVLAARYQSTTIISNPFFDIEMSDPRTGRVILTGVGALILIQIYISFICGVIGLIIAALLRVFRGRTR